MEISFRDAALRRYAEDFKLAQRKLGTVMAKKYQLRLVALIAARNLAVFLPPFRGPERCHELVGNLAGIFSMDLKQPYRLLFEANAPFEAGADITVKQKWESINSITLVAIKDTHE
jgi:proteic killer suppression protein